MEIITFVIGMVSGIFVGSTVVEKKWRDNAWNVQRICSGRVFFKVTAIDDPKSWRNTMIHKQN